MPSFVGARYFTEQAEAKESPINVNELPSDKLKSIVHRAALSNQDRENEALRQADSYSFQVAHPELRRTEANTRLLNHQLQSWGITRPTYPDFERAYGALRESGLLTIDESKGAPKTFKGTLTKQTFNSVHEMIGAERQAALQTVPTPTAEEEAFNSLPHDQALQLLKQREAEEQQKSNLRNTQTAGDAWIIARHPEYIDSEANGNLMRHQLASNGVLEDVATVHDFEKAYNDLRASGLLKLNPKELEKQRAEELKQMAAKAFDNQPSEEEMEKMPLEELRRRANEATR